MDNTTEEKNTQPWPCTSDEACCCDPVAEQAPVTVDMIEEAYNRLEELVNQCKTPVILHIKIEKGESVNSRTSTCKAVTKMAGAKVRNGLRLVATWKPPEFVSPAIPKLFLWE